MKNNYKIVALGGGTGLSTLLKGLRYRSNEITAIVSVADDGGSSGRLRQEYEMLPPGDIRNCISALAGDDYKLGEFLNYRFNGGSLEGHTIGNLIITALNDMHNDFESAVNAACDIFGTQGRVVPVSVDDMNLAAIMSDGRVLRGESNIGAPRNDDTFIKKVFLDPKEVRATDSAVAAIRNADVIIMGPGSLYTSVIPNLLVDGIAEEIKKSRAKKIYVCNIMTQPGETDGYTAYDHLSAIERHTYKGIVDVVIVNAQEIPNELIGRYAQTGSYAVVIDEEKFSCEVIKARILLAREDYVRHNFSRLARTIGVLCNKER